VLCVSSVRFEESLVKLEGVSLLLYSVVRIPCSTAKLKLWKAGSSVSHLSFSVFAVGLVRTTLGIGGGGGGEKRGVGQSKKNLHGFLWWSGRGASVCQFGSGRAYAGWSSRRSGFSHRCETWA
jgi:hypothetical protein